MLNFGHFLSDFLVLFVVHFAQFVVHRFCTTFVINYLSMCCKIKQDRIRITEKATYSGGFFRFYMKNTPRSATLLGEMGELWRDLCNFAV